MCGIEEGAVYQEQVQLNRAEQMREGFAQFLFPVSASHVIAQGHPDPKVKRLIGDAHEAYFERIRTPMSPERIGDLVIWAHESKELRNVLRARFSVDIRERDVDDYTIGYGTLARSVSVVRKEQLVADMLHGSSLSGGSQAEAFKLFLVSAGISYSKQVLTIDPTAPDITPQDESRFRLSAGLSRAFLGKMFFCVSDLIQRI